MSALTAAIYDRLAGDTELASMLAIYRGEPAVFTVDPAPGDAVLPFIVSAGHAVDTAWDTKTTQGREIWRDVRCYAPADGSATLIESIAERVRALLHRQALAVDGFGVWLTECSGPIASDDTEAYGRIVTVRLVMQMEE